MNWNLFSLTKPAAPKLRPPANTPVGDPQAPLRILIVANALIPTVQISLLLPLAPLTQTGRAHLHLITEKDIVLRTKENASPGTFAGLFDLLRPTHVVFCRYSGPGGPGLLKEATLRHLPSIYIIDDDLLNVPRELGEQKYLFHNDPARLTCVNDLLRTVDLVYCSNSRLAEKLRAQGITDRLHVPPFFCTPPWIKPPAPHPSGTLGYMGFDHAHDFALVLPALVKILHRHPQLTFELFGKIPRPAALHPFGDRVRVLPAVSDYEQFLHALADRHWDIGICPLAATPFNQVKNINKWMEYTAVGTAVIASQNTIYDDCCAQGCGLLVDDDGWESALNDLITQPAQRLHQINLAQARLRATYSPETLITQIQHAFSLAESSHRIA